MHAVIRQTPRLETSLKLRALQYTRSNTTPLWICADCRIKLHTGSSNRRYISSDQKPIIPPPPPPSPSASTTSSSTLPSATARNRSDLSNRLTVLLDGLLARASVAGQHINAYTGTDYSGIETLRRDIIAQEQHVKSTHISVESAKAAHHEEYAKQAAAQKEIVALLERKSSWTPADLERYMSLVRSEHVNDQAVQTAKRSLDGVERELADSRALLERLERKQYHEEQVWSDTIRRNSTWVTFGLMGLNVVLLLAQILVFEPMRRERIVRDVKLALDEKTMAAPIMGLSGTLEDVVPAIHVEDKGQEKLQMDAMPVPTKEETEATPSVADEVLPEEIVDPPGTLTPQTTPPKTLEDHLEKYQQKVRDLFSDRTVHLRQVEITTIALQGAASGVAVMAVLFALLRQR